MIPITILLKSTLKYIFFVVKDKLSFSQISVNGKTIQY